MLQRCWPVLIRRFQELVKRLLPGPEMDDNVIPFISGEEEKSEQEPLKIWGSIGPEGVIPAQSPSITTQCLRVNVSDGHMAAVFASFAKKPTLEQIKEKWATFEGRSAKIGSAQRSQTVFALF